jgi:hypothetical protein
MVLLLLALPFCLVPLPGLSAGGLLSRRKKQSACTNPFGRSFKAPRWSVSAALTLGLYDRAVGKQNAVKFIVSRISASFVVCADGRR